MELSDKNILLTGASGFLGRHVLAELLKQGARRERIRTPRSNELDLRQWEHCRAAVKDIDVVIHVAALVGGIGINREHPGRFFYDNAIMGIQLMEAARQANVKKFVTIGTVCSYPKYAPIPLREDDLWAGYPEETNAPYGLAKKMLLVQGHAYRDEYGFNAIYLLPVNLYGPHDNFNPKSSHVIPALIRKVDEAMRAGKAHIDAWGTGTPTREFLYVEDAAEAIVRATRSYDKREPVNLGAGREISIKELTGIICRHMGFNGEIRWDSSKPDGQPRRMLDTARAEREFDFKAKTGFEDGLRRTIEWYKTHGRS